MTDVKKRIVALLWHPGMQYRLFGSIEKALPNEVSVRLLGMPQMVLEKNLLSMLSRRTPLPDEIESLVSRDFMRKTCTRPDLATERYKNRIRRTAAEWYRFFQRKLEGVDLLVVWHGYKRPASLAVVAAKEHGAQVIYCENGVLPGTLAMDTLGINFESSLTGLDPEYYRSLSMDSVKMDLILNTALQQRPFSRIARVKSNDTDDDRELPDRYVLYAMQVHDDSQVLLFSQRFPSMESAVPYVADCVAEYNRRYGDTIKLVVKEHPTDYGRVDYAAMRAALPDVYFLRTTPVSDIIDRALAVVTLNSTVGVEGLLRLRPVITLGDASYNVPGMVWHVGPDDDLVDSLAKAIDKPVDQDLIIRFLYFLRYEYLVPVSKTGCTPATVRPAADRIMDILDGRWPSWNTK